MGVWTHAKGCRSHAPVGANHCRPIPPFSKFLWDMCGRISIFPIFPYHTPQPCGLALRYRSAMGWQCSNFEFEPRAHGVRASVDSQGFQHGILLILHLQCLNASCVKFQVKLEILHKAMQHIHCKCSALCKKRGTPGTRGHGSCLSCSTFSSGRRRARSSSRLAALRVGTSTASAMSNAPERVRRRAVRCAPQPRRWPMSCA